MKNVLVEATLAAQKHISKLVEGGNEKELRKAELLKLSKADLVDMLLATEKFEGVKIEDIVKPILADPACAWLDYQTIADLVKAHVPSASTSNKSIASYASKYPTQKGWTVQPRKSQADRMAAMMQLINLKGV